MGLFDEVKQNVTVRQAAEMYGLKPNRSGLICCIFHNDKSPSMKVDRRYYCFGCGCTGDAIDFTVQLFGLGLKEAAQKLADDFGIAYADRIDGFKRKPISVKKPEQTPEEKWQSEYLRCLGHIWITGVCCWTGKCSMHRRTGRKHGTKDL